MSTDEYDQAEKLFCGKWKNVQNENIEAFMAAAGKHLILSLITILCRISQKSRQNHEEPTCKQYSFVLALKNWNLVVLND